VELLTPEIFDSLRGAKQQRGRISKRTSIVIAEDEAVAAVADSLVQSLSKVTTGDRIRLKAAKISERNLFGSLSRKSTVSMLERTMSLSEASEEMPDVMGWCEQRRSDGRWRRRWLVCSGAHILWNDEHVDMTLFDARDIAQRRRFSGHCNLMTVTKIEGIVKGKGSEGQRSFRFMVSEVCAERKTKGYVWRADSEQSRNSWVRGLTQRVELLHEFKQHLHEQ